MSATEAADTAFAGDDLAASALRALDRAGQTLATAESLTGGALASALVEVPGASTVYVGGVVAYATRLKTELLGVPAELVESEGVVSAACARAMAEGARSRLGADVALSTTGVAGPDSQDGRPPGTVFVACVAESGTLIRELSLDGDRTAVRRATVEAALLLVLDQLGVDHLAAPGPEVGAGE